MTAVVAWFMVWVAAVYLGTGAVCWATDRAGKHHAARDLAQLRNKIREERHDNEDYR